MVGAGSFHTDAAAAGQRFEPSQDRVALIGHSAPCAAVVYVADQTVFADINTDEGRHNWSGLHSRVSQS